MNVERMDGAVYRQDQMRVNINLIQEPDFDWKSYVKKELKRKYGIECVDVEITDTETYKHSGQVLVSAVYIVIERETG